MPVSSGQCLGITVAAVLLLVVCVGVLRTGVDHRAATAKLSHFFGASHPDDGSNKATEEDELVTFLEKKNRELEDKVILLHDEVANKSKQVEIEIYAELDNRANKQKELDILSRFLGAKNDVVRRVKWALEKELKELLERAKTLNKHIDVGHLHWELNNEAGKWRNLLDVHGNLTDIEEAQRIDNETLAKFNKWALGPVNRNQLFKAFDILMQITKEENIPFFLSEGSLLGSYRHHGLIPWDGDIDVAVPAASRQGLVDAFQKKNYKDWAMATKYPTHKIYPVNGGETRAHWPWKTPFVDIFYFDQNDTHIFGQGWRTLPKADVFPLTKRPFQGRMAPGPRDPHRVLMSCFHKANQTLSPMGGFVAEHQCKGNHRNIMKDFAINRPPPLVECSQMLRVFPFVRHSRGEGGAYCKEELIFRGKVLNVHYRNSTGLAAC